MIFSALPSSAIGKLVQPIDKESSEILLSIKSESVAVVNLGYKNMELPFQAFGYLVPSCEGEKIMGTVFDSAIFPQHNKSLSEVRLTVMTKDFDDTLNTAISSMEKHLNISQKPDACAVHIYRGAIPQFEVGHADKIGALEQRLKEKCPLLKLVGNYLYGVSVNDCVTNAKGAAQAWRIKEI